MFSNFFLPSAPALPAHISVRTVWAHCDPKFYSIQPIVSIESSTSCQKAPEKGDQIRPLTEKAIVRFINPRNPRGTSNHCPLFSARSPSSFGSCDRLAKSTGAKLNKLIARCEWSFFLMSFGDFRSRAPQLPFTCIRPTRSQSIDASLLIAVDLHAI